MVAEIMGTEKQAMKAAETGTNTAETKTEETNTFWKENAEANYVWLCVLPQLRSAFGYFSLKKGTQFFGWFYLILTFCITVASFGPALLSLSDIPSHYTRYDDGTEGRPRVVDRIVRDIMTGIMFAPVVWCSYLLLRGVEWRKPELIRPFVVLLYVYTALNMFLWLAVLELDTRGTVFDCPLPFLLFAVNAYSLLVVNSYQRQLQNEIAHSKPQLPV